MADFLQGYLGTQQAGVEARNDVTVAIRNWFANRNPLVTRLPYVPVERVDFLMYTHKYRARSTTVTAAVSASTTTGLSLGDATFLMNHDVLQLIDSTSGASEYVQISGDPTGSQTVTVIRGVAGTTATTSVASGSTVNLIGNSRTGGEVNQTGLTTIGVSRTQYCADVSVSCSDRRLGPDGEGAGHAGRDSDAIRLQHDRSAPEHGGRHRELRVLRHRAGARTTRPGPRPR